MFTGIMSISIERTIINMRLCFFRCMSTSVDVVNYEEHKNNSFVANEDLNKTQSEKVKSLKVAILGMPNVGKSTLINQLVHRPICATSSKVHTTRVKCHAIYSQEDTQLIFIDTPGLVSNHEWKKYHLEPSFKNDARESMMLADIVGVIQDVGSSGTRGIINKHIIDLLKHTRQEVPSILVLNKVDLIKRKDVLLDLVKGLTSKKGWPHFQDVFMISALMKEGIDDLRNYLLDSAKQRNWDYEENVFTDQATDKVIQRVVQSKLLDALPNELPYRLTVELEQLNVCLDDSMDAVVLIKCPSDRISRLLLGKGGAKIKSIALAAEQEICNAFKTAIRLKIIVHFKESK